VDFSPLETRNGLVRAYAQVIALNEKRAVLIAEPQAACGSCAVQKGCGVSSLTRSLGRKSLRFETSEIEAPRAGDWYVIGLPSRDLMKMAATTYLVPLVAMIVAALAAAELGAGDGLAALSSLTGLLLGFCGVRWVIGATRLNRMAQPVILGPAAIRSGIGDGCHVSG